MTAVSLRGVTKRYGAVHALDNVSIDIASGELLALLGPSGCGKTTLLRSVAGLVHPDGGVIEIGGRDVSGVPTRERPIGMVFQSYALFPNMTIRENIAFPLSVRKRPAAEIKRRVDDLLDLVRLGPQADRYPNQVSGGQAQRCALGRALAPAPDVLLLDEPLSALDALVRGRLRDEIRRVQQLVKTTALYVTHDQSEALAIADRVGGNWPRTLREAAVLLAGEQSDDGIGLMLLQDIHALFTESTSDRIATSDLLERLNGLDERPWCTFAKGQPLTAHRLARLLKPYDVLSQSVRSEKQTFKGYYWENFTEAWDRYLPAKVDFSKRNNVTTRASIGENEGFGSVTTGFCDGSKSVRIPNDTKGCDDVTVQKPEYPPSIEADVSDLDFLTTHP